MRIFFRMNTIVPKSFYSQYGLAEAFRNFLQSRSALYDLR